MNYNDGKIPNVIVYEGDLNHKIEKRLNDSWDDPEDSVRISAYMNLRSVLQWWKNTFGRDYLDRSGNNVHLVVNEARGYLSLIHI